MSDSDAQPPGVTSDGSLPVAEPQLNPERYRFIFNSAHLGIIATDLEGRFTDANPAYCQMLGYSLDEILQLSFRKITHPVDLQITLQSREQVRQGQEASKIIEKRYFHKSGAIVWARLVGSPIYDGAGNMTGMFAMVENITARKQAEDELRRMQDEIAASEQRLRRITKATLDLVWDWDLVNNHLWWGEGLQALFGFDEQLMGKDEKFWLRRAHRDDRPLMLAAFQSVIDGESDGWHLKFRIKKMDGNFTHVEERAFAIRNDNGKLLHIVGGVTDISARLELEDKLRQSQRLESLGQLTGGVAHDFNNLLTVMLGNAELLMAGLDQQPMLQELAAAITRSALQGADLTHRLLAFARRQALEPKNINLNHLVENMGKILMRTLGEEINFKMCPAEALWLCVVDPNQMEAAILNLCLNARDAMPDGGELVMETSNVSLDGEYAIQQLELKPGDYVCLAISDTGIGIPGENMERVLEPFFTTKIKGKGTGLGLSTIFGFIKQSFGHLNIYSEVGQGTTIKIYLPRTRVDAIEDLQAGAVTEQPRLGTETILLVEDDPLVRQFAQTQLVSLGYQVHTAANGLEALELVRKHDNIALLFTDVVMPGGMGGRQLAEAACQLTPLLKVLYTSGYTENSIVHNGRLDDGVHLLGKPYQRHDLARKLREILDAP